MPNPPRRRARSKANTRRRTNRRVRRQERRGTRNPLTENTILPPFPLEGGGSKFAEGNRRQPPVHRY